MIHFSGVRTIALPVAEVAAKLSDASFLASCIPDAKITTATADHVALKLKPKVSFLSGSLDTTMDVTHRDPGKQADFLITSRTIGASSKVTATLRFVGLAAGETEVPWEGEIAEITGLLKMVPKGLLQGTAEKVIEEAWVAVTARLMANE